MLSFELSAIDLILVVAVIVLLVLYLTRPATKSPAEEKVMALDADFERERETQSATQPQENSPGCPHHFGYLKNLGGAPIPDECLSCSRTMNCFIANE